MKCRCELRFRSHRAFTHASLLRVPLCISWAFLVYVQECFWYWYHRRLHIVHYSIHVEFQCLVQMVKISFGPSNIDSHGHLWSANCAETLVPLIRMSTYRGCAFGHTTPATWNTLTNILKCSIHSLFTFSHRLL